MTKKRNPIPKKQRDISNSLTNENPYIKENGDSSSKKEIKRGDQTSFKGDDVKPISIGLKDIDESIIFYFNNIIKNNYTYTLLSYC